MKFLKRRRFPLTFAVLFTLAAVSTNYGQFSWTVTSLAPSGYQSGYVLGGNGAQQVGFAFLNDGVHQAALWNGTAGSFTVLQAAGTTNSHARATNGSQQGGIAYSASAPDGYAALWSGSAATQVNLNPAGATYSEIKAMSSTQQGGSSGTDQSHATLWSGTAASAVNLNPAGATGSSINAMTETQQGGLIYDHLGEQQAALWSGSAASHVSLHPAGRASSAIYAMNGSYQGGSAATADSSHAALWQGTAGSYVDLRPTGALESSVNAIAGQYQAGSAAFNLVEGSGYSSHAALWNLTADSFVDLHSTISDALGMAFSLTRLTSAYTDGSTLYLAGYGFLGTPQMVPFTMTTPIPEPATVALWCGALGLILAVWRRRAVRQK